MLRLGDGATGGDGIFRRENRTANGKADGLPGNNKGDGIAHREVMGLGKLLLYQAAVYIPIAEKTAGTKIGPVDGHVTLINFKSGLHILPHAVHIHGDGGSGLDLTDTGNVAQAFQLLPGDGRGVHPEVRQVALGKIGLDGVVHETPGPVQPGKDPGAEKAEKHHGDDLHGIGPEIAQKLSAERMPCAAAFGRRGSTGHH